jgi:hypothetical protein
MTDGVTRTDVDKTMWLVTLPEIITNSTRQEENLVVILSREESWDPASDHFPTVVPGLLHNDTVPGRYRTDEDSDFHCNLLASTEGPASVYR